MQTMQRREFFKRMGTSLAGFSILSLNSCTKPKASPPNILFAISDDQTWKYTGISGCKYVNTPAFDRVAKEGVLFERAYAVAPQCSPSRASILTSRNIWQLEEAGTHASLFPKKFTVFTDMLEESGYQLGYTGKPWAPGNWKDAGWTRNPVGPEYNEKQMEAPKGISNTDYASNFESFFENRDKTQPFFFWFGAHEPHRSYLKGAGIQKGKNPDDVDVPKYLPDVLEIRSDMLDFAVEIEWFDMHLARILELLEKNGELENTLVVVTADNGMPFPRAKANLYDHGTHLPLAMRWPKKIKGNRKITDLVSFIDYAPTFLEVAGVQPHPDMIGKSLVPLLYSEKSGAIDAEREYVLTGRERHTHARPENFGYPSRAINNGKYLYIHNFKPDRWPAGDPFGSGDPEGFHDIDACPSKTLLIDNQDKKGYKKYFEMAMAKRPESELFDLEKDPDCIENLAELDEYKDTLSELKNRLFELLKEQGDPRVTGNGDIFESYPRFSRMRQFKGFKKRGEYNPAFK